MRSIIPARWAKSTARHAAASDRLLKKSLSSTEPIDKAIDTSATMAASEWFLFVAFNAIGRPGCDPTACAYVHRTDEQSVGGCLGSINHDHRSGYFTTSANIDDPRNVRR